MDKFILFSYFRSANSYRVRIALNIKKISFEYRAIDILSEDRMKNVDLITSRPSGKVPCLIHSEKIIVQSAAIVEYLDNEFPEPPLFPKDNYKRATVQRICHTINSDISPLHNPHLLKELGIWFGVDKKKQFEWSAYWIKSGLVGLEKQLSNCSGTYSFGDEITMADIFVVPQINRAYRFGVDMNQFPIAKSIYENCLKIEAFHNAAPENQPDTPSTYFGEIATK